jgi:predicted nucleic acid-binding protein
MKVVDASAITAILFDEPSGSIVVPMLRDETLVAPPLLEFEVANACTKKSRARPQEHEALLRAFRTLPDWGIAWHVVDLGGAVALAHRLGLSVYDASYLWLALELNTALVTLDTKLQRAYSQITGP